MFKRSLIILLEIGALVVVVLSVVLFWAAYYVDTDEFRDSFVGVMEQVTGQPVTLKGEFNIALYPTISLEVLGLVIESDADSGEQPLVEFDDLQVSARLIPLLSRKLELRTILVEGMTVHVVRSENGEFNWQSVIDRQTTLFADSEGGDQIAGVSLAGLEVVDASFAFADKQAGDVFELSGIDIRTGTIVPGEDVPFSAKSDFSWQKAGLTSQFILKGVIETHENNHLRLKDANIYATVGGDFLPQGANPGEMTAGLKVDWEDRRLSIDDFQLSFLGLRAKGSLISENMDKALSATGRIEFQSFTPSDIILRYFPDAPTASVDGLKRGTFSTNFQVDEKGVALKNLSVSLDDLKVHGRAQLVGYKSPLLDLDLHGTDVNLDRYLPLFETGTPFIWDDFNLGFWSAIRGKAVANAKSFTVLGQTLTDIRLALDANKARIAANADARFEGVENLKGKAQFRFGANARTHVPTFGGQLELSCQSPTDGFPHLQNEMVRVDGDGRAYLKVDIEQMDCPPEVRSIGILRHLSGDVKLLFGSGMASYKDGATRYELPSTTSEYGVKVTPISQQGEEFFTFDTVAHARAQGGKDIRNFSVSMQGPLTTAVDSFHLKSGGVRVKTSMSGALYTNQLSRINANGMVSFDSVKHTVSVKDATIRTLETTIKAEGDFVDLDARFKGKGRLDIPSANVRRIIFLLSKFGVRTDDPEALKAAGLHANYEVDDSGFRLTELEGRLDGMSFNGHVVGQGLKDPKLVFSLAAGAFDLDRYLPPSIEPTLQEIREGKEPKKAEPVDLPLKFLRWLNVSGKAWFEEFKLADIRAKGLSAVIEAEDGDIRISKGTGKIHGGDLTANWTGKVGKDSLSTHLTLHVEDMQAGPLLKDMADREYVRGETDVDIDLISFGRTDDDIVANLDGKTWARVRNGSFKFTGYDLPRPKVDDHDRQMGASQRKEVERRTVFTKALGYFTVKKGVFKADRFRVEAPPVLQSYGSGQFSLPDNTIDLAIRNDFVVVPSVTLRLQGKLTDPSVSMPTGEILDKTVRNILSLPEKSFNFLRDLF